MAVITFSLEQLQYLPSSFFEPLPSEIDPSSKELVPSWRVTKDQRRLDLNTVYMTRLHPLKEVTFYIFRPGKKENAPSFVGEGKFKVVLSELGIRVRCIVPTPHCNGAIEELRKTGLEFLQIEPILELVKSYYIDVDEMIRAHYSREGVKEIEELRKTGLEFLQIKLILELVKSYYINVHEMIREDFMEQHLTEKLPRFLPKPPFSVWEDLCVWKHLIETHPFHLVALSSQNPHK